MFPKYLHMILEFLELISTGFLFLQFSLYSKQSYLLIVYVCFLYKLRFHFLVFNSFQQKLLSMLCVFINVFYNFVFKLKTVIQLLLIFLIDPPLCLYFPFHHLFKSLSFPLVTKKVLQISYLSFDPTETPFRVKLVEIVFRNFLVSAVWIYLGDVINYKFIFTIYMLLYLTFIYVNSLEQIIQFIMSISFASTLTFEQVDLAYNITMFAIWGIGIDIPRIIIRYGRSYPQAQNFHAISMTMCSLLTVMYQIVWTVVYYQQPAFTALVNIRLGAFVVGWILVGSLLVQTILGFVTRAEINNEQLSTNLFVLKGIHRYLGITISLIGKVLVALLLNVLSPDDLFRAWLFLLGAILIIFAILECIYRIQTKKCAFKFPMKNNPKYEKQLKEILQNLNSDKEEFDDHKDKGIRYLIVDNDMYYIDQQFMHPGGEAILSLFNGRQINYLFKGTHQISFDYPRHKHTKYAMNYLQNRFVGKLNVKPLFATQKVADDLIQWKLKQIYKISGDGNMLIFQTAGGLVDDTLHIDQFGKYMMLRCPNQQVMRKTYRPYTLLKCLTKNNQKRIQRLKSHYKYYIYGQSDNSMVQSMAKGGSVSLKLDNDILQENATLPNQLTFMIKSYKSGEFSNFILKSKGDKFFEITGPYGRGMQLKPQSKGVIIIIAAGTGILPFIDFFAYMFQKTVLDLIKQKAGQSAYLRANQQKADFSGLQGLKVLLIGSFLSAQHFYMDAIVKDLYHLNRKYQLKQFDMMLRYNNNQSQPDIRMIKETFGQSFIKSIVEGNQPDKVYFCGPSGLQQDIRKSAKSLNLQDKFIYI